MFEWQYEVKEPAKVVKVEKTQEELEKLREVELEFDK